MAIPASVLGIGAAPFPSKTARMEILIAAVVHTLDFIMLESSTICTRKTRAISFASIASQAQDALELDVTSNEAILE
ncbi:hypothetical protein IG631_12617 [Alternaria alternata]|nr:hypothetical protein IG631_12617 [Alternaria alternata]